MLGKGIFLSVLRKKFPFLGRLEKQVYEGVIRAFGLDPRDPAAKFDWEKFLKFKRVLLAGQAKPLELFIFLVKVCHSPYRPYRPYHP